MIPILFEATEQAFATMGLGAMKDCLSCKVAEERNGPYELELTYPITGVRFGDLQLNRIILAKPNYTDQEQPFRIYKIAKPLDGIVTVNARHISYDLSGYPLASSGTAISGLTNALTYISSHSTVTPNPFTITADHTSVGTFRPTPIRSIRQWMGGVEGSLLDAFGGEWHFDRFTCTLCSSRGANRGVTIMYGKNLTQLTQEESSADVYTGVIGYYLDESGTYVEGAEQSTGSSMTTPTRVLTLDVSDQYQTKPTTTQINNYVTAYIARNGVANPKVNLDVDFIQLDQVTDRVDLCDTVTVYYEKLGISATAKCIKTVWDTLLDRYDSVTVGDAKTSLADTISDLQGGESSPSVGYKESQALTSNINLATSTWMTHSLNSSMPSVSLTAGLWVIEAKAVFSADAAGSRVFGVDSSSSHTNIDVRVAPASSGTTQIIYSKVVEVATSATYYMSAWQDSGSTLKLNIGSYLKAVRIG